MSIIALTGIETQSVTAGIELDNVTNAPTINTSVPASGAACLDCEKGSASTCYAGITFDAAVSKAYAQQRIRVQTSVAALCSVMILGTSYTTVRAQIRLATDNTLELWSGTTKLGSSSAALSANTWYLIELMHDDATDTCIAKLNGVIFASGTSTTGTMSTIAFGMLTSTTGKIQIDDVVVDDAWWCGDLKIVHAHPTGAGIFSPATGTYADIDEVTPDDDTTKITLTSANTKAYFTLQTGASLGIGANDVIAGLFVDCRYKFANTTNDSMKVGLRDSAGNIFYSATVLGNTTYSSALHSSGPTVLRQHEYLYRDSNNNRQYITRALLDTFQIGAELTLASPPTTTITQMALRIAYATSAVNPGVPLYVTKSGSDANAGSSLAVRSSGSDGATSSLTNTLTSAGASWTSADIGHNVIVAGAVRRILTVPSATTLTYDGVSLGTASGQAWKIGGAWLTPAMAMSNSYPGDTIYIGAGYYQDNVNPTRSGTHKYPITIFADTEGMYTNEGDGVVAMTLTTSTSYGDGSGAAITNSGTVSLIKVAVSDIDVIGFTCEIGGGAIPILTIAATSKRASVRNCLLLGTYYTGSGEVSLLGEGMFVDSCFMHISGGSTLTYTGDYSNLTNCVLIGAGGVFTSGTGDTTSNILNNLVINSNNSGVASDAATTLVGNVYNNVFLGFYQITLDTTSGGNVAPNIFQGTNRPNRRGMGPVPLIRNRDFAQCRSKSILPLFRMLEKSPMVGFGIAGSLVKDAVGNRRPLGLGSLPLPGPVEFNPSRFVDVSSKILGLYSTRLKGTASRVYEQGFYVPSGKSITISCVCEYDATYASNNNALPKMSIIADADMGIAEVTDTHVGGGSGVEDTLSVQSAVSTKSDYVFIRLDTYGSLLTSYAFYDNFTVTIS